MLREECVGILLDAGISVAVEATAIAAFIGARRVCAEQRNFSEHFPLFAFVDRAFADIGFHLYHLFPVIQLMLRNPSRPVSCIGALRSAARSQSLRRIVRENQGD